MKNLSLFLIGLALIYTPVSVNGKQCFSVDLGYPCCKGKAVVYTDKSGDWGVENDEWCGIGGGDDSESCFSLALGYPCCKSDKVVYTDKSGDWGVENGEWCGIGGGDDDTKIDTDTCFALVYGYTCCETCEVKYSDASGKWGKENKKWCGIKDSCNVNNSVQSDIDLDFEFLKLENKKKNMLYSPLSIKYALSMLQEGAVGNTFDEINNIMGNTTLTKYTSIDKVLSLANGLFIRDSFYPYVKPQYIITLENKYEAEVVQDEFKDANNANQWIEDKTLGIIKDMLKDEQVQSPDSAMLIINALAIDMGWTNQFNFRNTNGKTFYMDNGQEMVATTMYKKDSSKDASYYIDDKVTVLTMKLEKYNGIQFEFMAIMPKENLNKYVENVSTEQIKEMDEKLILASDEEYGITIRIPKFKFNYDLDFKNDLLNLNVKDAFDKKKANLTKISDLREKDENLYVSDALHKADIEFTEKGVKAAAVTVFAMTVAASMPRPTYPVDVTIDKPFMFVIRDTNTKDIWFTGTVYEPNKWENDKSEYKSY